MSQQQAPNMQQQQQQPAPPPAPLSVAPSGEPQQVLHVKQDSATDMEQLFAVLQNNNAGGGAASPAGLPFAKRKLPASFFTPPSKPQHSREGSSDSSVGPGGLHIVHGRSRSSPAMLPHTLSALSPAPPVSAAPAHFKQQSLGDLLDDGLTPLPHGWEMAKTAEGQRYFMK